MQSPIYIYTHTNTYYLLCIYYIMVNHAGYSPCLKITNFSAFQTRKAICLEIQDVERILLRQSWRATEGVIPGARLCEHEVASWRTVRISHSDFSCAFCLDHVSFTRVVALSSYRVAFFFLVIFLYRRNTVPTRWFLADAKLCQNASFGKEWCQIGVLREKVVERLWENEFNIVTQCFFLTWRQACRFWEMF